jgi:steroid delta-isomerase-like uncharacterized protein
MADTPDAVVRTWFEEVWNQGKEATIDRLYASDCVVHGLVTADGSPMRGPAAFKPFYRRFRTALPDMHIEVERTLTENDMVTAYCHVTGSHKGDGLGIPSSGKSVEFWGIVIARIRNGQIAEAWNVFDFLSMYQQMGALPKLPS